MGRQNYERFLSVNEGFPICLKWVNPCFCQWTGIYLLNPAADFSKTSFFVNKRFFLQLWNFPTRGKLGESCEADHYQFSRHRNFNEGTRGEQDPNIIDPLHSRFCALFLSFQTRCKRISSGHCPGDVVHPPITSLRKKQKGWKFVIFILHHHNHYHHNHHNHNHHDQHNVYQEAGAASWIGRDCSRDALAKVARETSEAFDLIIITIIITRPKPAWPSWIVG